MSDLSTSVHPSDAPPSTSEEGCSTSPVKVPEDLTLSFITSRLKRSGPYYWNRADLADCILIVPLSPHTLQLMQRRKSEGRAGGRKKDEDNVSQRTTSAHSRVLNRKKRNRRGEPPSFSSSDGEKSSKDGRGTGSDQTSTGESSSSLFSLGDIPAMQTKSIHRRSQRCHSAPPASLGRPLPRRSSLLNPSPIVDSNLCLKMTFNAHADFLMQCGLIARIFSASQLERLSLTARLFSRSQNSKAKESDSKVKILATSPHTVVYLPLPDPASFSYLLYYLYHDSMQPLLQAMNAGTLRWQGVIANIDFLDLDARIKQQLGKWWREHILER